LSQIVKRYVPHVILVAVAFFMAGDTILLEKPYNDLASSGTAVVSIIGSFAVLISVTMLSRLHVRRVQRKTRVIESSALLICMWATLIWGFFRFAFQGVSPTREFAVQSIFNAIVSPGDSTIYSILAFFIAAAAYRAFRARSVEATLLLLAGSIVMLGYAPIGEMISGHIPSLTKWIMDVPNTAGNRVIILSGIIGIVALYVRIILGYERGWMGRGD